MKMSGYELPGQGPPGNILQSLDARLWHIFRDTTELAGRYLGWNKYELLRWYLRVSGLACLGAGLYRAEHTISYPDAGSVMAVAAAASGMAIGILNEVDTHHQEKKELEELVSTGALKGVAYDYGRLFALGAGTYSWAAAAYLNFFQPLSTTVPMQQREQGLQDLYNFATIAFVGGTLLVLNAVRSYLLNQALPPSAPEKEQIILLEEVTTKIGT